ncbi:MAG TPA: AMP-binding protein, partial [Acidimicrobiales bacterium]|nr:AMP-binding protein [Acidimicrobiales bacterium]
IPSWLLRRHRSIPAMIRTSAAKFGENPAIIDGGCRWSFSDLERMMLRSGAAAVANDILPGDRVAVWAPNRAEYVAAAAGILAVGAWLVPLNTRYRGEEAAYVLEKTRASALFMVRHFLELDYLSMLRQAAPHLPVLDHPIFLDRADGGNEGMGWAEFLEAGHPVPDKVVIDHIEAIDPEDVSDVMFTSGTTSRPKGVLLGHRQSLLAFDVWNEAGYRLGPEDRVMIIPPFFHCFGYKAGWMMAALVGATSYPVAVFDAEAALRLVQEERITVLPGPPTVFTSMLDHPHCGRYDLSSLRAAFVGATSVPISLVRRLYHELGVAIVSTGYGLTEATAAVSVTHPDDPPEAVAGSAGRIIPGVQVDVVDEDGRPVPFGAAGELMVRGFNVMRGYLDDPEATAETLTPDGWLRTGDIATYEAEGLLRIVDRKKDIYIAGGFNVSPAEVENTLGRHPAVAEVAVIGVPDHRLGEVGAAFVVPRPGQQPGPDDIVLWAREHLANYKVPRMVRLVDSLPRNASGKVVKTKLRQLHDQLVDRPNSRSRKRVL